MSLSKELLRGNGVPTTDIEEGLEVPGRGEDPLGGDYQLMVAPLHRWAEKMLCNNVGAAKTSASHGDNFLPSDLWTSCTMRREMDDTSGE